MSEGTLAQREHILQCSDVPSELVEIVEWKTTVLVKGLSLEEKGEIQKKMPTTDTLNYADSLALFTIAGCYNPETEEKIFTSDDLDILKHKASKPMELVGNKVLELSGYSENESKKG